MAAAVMVLVTADVMLGLLLSRDGCCLVTAAAVRLRRVRRMCGRGPCQAASTLTHMCMLVCT
eukprot:4096157-Prymnesium_polylepis.1